VKFWLQVLAWLALLFGGLELASRRWLGHAPREQYDPQFDRLTAPDQVIVWADEGWSRSRTNELGHADAPMPATPPPDGILVIGDSYTEARQVSRDERFTDRVGRALGRRVYNVGHTGWSPLNALGFLQSPELAKFAPKTVVVQISGNDLGDMVTKSRPHLVGDAAPYTVQLPPREKKGMAARLNQLRLSVSRSAVAGNLVVAALKLFQGGKGEGDAGAVGCNAPDPRAIAALPWLFDSLHRAHPDVRLLYLPQIDYHHGCVDECAASRHAFELAAATAQLPLIDTTAPICARFAETHQPLNGFWNTVPGTGHYNAEGHEVIAGVLAAALR
jgi:hypothetical protein